MKQLLKRFRHDITGIFYLGTALFLGLALVSFHPTDQSFNSIGQGRNAVANYCGYVGSFLSDLLYQGFGVTAWFFIATLAWIALRAFGGDIIKIKNLRFLWAALLVLTCSSLIAMYAPQKRIFSDQILLSGLLGLVISQALIKVFNFAGVAVILWSTAVVLLLFVSEKTIAELMAWPKSAASSVLVYLKTVEFFQKTKKPKVKEKSATEETIQENKKALADNLRGKWPLNKVLNKKSDEEAAEETPKGRFFALNEEAGEGEEETEKSAIKEMIVAPARRKVELKAKVQRKIENWELPKLSILEDPPATRVKVDEKEIKRKAEILTDKLEQFSVQGSVVGAKPGPAVTLFEFKPNSDVRISKITDLADDLSLALSSESVRIIAPIPGRDVVGIETSNTQRETVYLKDILAEEEFWDEEMKLPIPLGKQANGEPKIVDLRKMPHLLVAGTTGSGKSVFTVSSITGLLFKHSPKTLRMILIDPKQVDLAAFNKIPHLIMPPIREAKKAVSALRWAIREMDKRYKSMNKFGARGLEGYNEIVSKLSTDKLTEHEKINEEFENANQKLEQYYYQPLPYIVIVVEEFGDLMAVDKVNVEQSVVRLAQMARACGIHLILAMQSPRKEVVTGLIKTNIPGRISFKVASKMDSRIILDDSGAERLLARGDMLFLSPGVAKALRHHGPWVADGEINEVSEFWSKQGEPEFDPIAMKALEGSGGGYDLGPSDEAGGDGMDSEDNEYDERYDEILADIAGMKEVSASLLQRKYRLGYPRAARMIEILEKEGVIGPANGSKPRQVLISSFKE